MKAFARRRPAGGRLVAEVRSGKKPVRELRGNPVVTGIPETYWLDARGRIVAHYPGEVSREQLEGGIRQMEEMK